MLIKTIRIANSENGLVTGHGGLSCIKVQYYQLVSVFSLNEFTRLREDIIVIWKDINKGETSPHAPIGIWFIKAGFYDFMDIYYDQLEELVELVEDAHSWVCLHQVIYDPQYK